MRARDWREMRTGVRLLLFYELGFAAGTGNAWVLALAFGVWVLSLGLGFKIRAAEERESQ